MKAHRFGFLLALALLVPFADRGAQAAAPAREWRFKVFLEDSPIGEQTFRLTEDGPRSTVRIEASLDVKILFFTAYSYRHENEEVWEDGCLTSIRTKTDDNGEPFRVSGSRSGEAFVVETAGGTESLPACVHSFAYWNLDRLRAPRLLNSQTGRYEPVSVREIGQETLRYRGSDVSARRYPLESPEFRIDLWYSDQKEWLALESLRGGRTLRYVRE
jgi:hypothetical protein